MAAGTDPFKISGMGVFVDNDGVTLVLGEAGGEVDRIRFEPPPIETPGWAVLVLVYSDGREPVRVHLSTREAANLAQILAAYIH